MSPNKAAGIFISYTLSENHCGHFSCNLIHYVLFNDFEQKYYLEIRQKMYISQSTELLFLDWCYLQNTETRNTSVITFFPT